MSDKSNPAPDAIADIDLNLLKVFEAIMAEESVSQAAVRLGISQSAASHSLSRLREILDDPLFERTGHGVRATPKAEELSATILITLQHLRKVLRKHQGAFDPTQETRRFTLDIPAGVDLAVAPELIRITADSPGITFRILTSRARDVLSELRFGHSALSIDFEVPQDKGFRSELIEQDEFVAIARTGHPAFEHGITAEQFETMPQVAVVFTRRDEGSPLTNRLRDTGVRRNVRLVVATLPAIASVVASSDLISSTSKGIATLLSKQFDIALHPMPVHVPPLPIMMIWHEQFDAEPGHVWLRQQVRGIFMQQTNIAA